MQSELASCLTNTSFQFPSNGKAYPKFLALTLALILVGFQFPSNGKAYPKTSMTFVDTVVPAGTKSFNSLQTGRHIQRILLFVIGTTTCVSIPFKREGISKVIRSGVLNRFVRCFNSLQTGRHIQRLFDTTFASEASTILVSIPFKREGISKVKT